ncbi:MAG: NERD domain-containing protein, partial [Candidatus Hodarchaeales archaeon]
MARFYRGANFGVKYAKYHRSAIKWFIENLDDSYRVLLEFTPIEGRQIDILVIHPKGIHCIEVKDWDWLALSEEGRCTFKDRKTSKSRYFRGNPFVQAQQQSDQLQIWLSSNFRRIFASVDRWQKVNVYPSVLSPKQDPPKMIGSFQRTKFLNGPEELKRIEEWKWGRLEATEAGIDFIIKTHRLSEISADDLTELMERRDWWTDSDILDQYQRVWGNLYAQNVERKDFETFEESFIELKFLKHREGKKIEEERPLTEVYRYQTPIFPFMPFVQMPGQKSIIERSLREQGVDEIAKPFEMWRASWQSGRDLFRGARDAKVDKNASSAPQEVRELQIASIYSELLSEQAWIFGPAASGKTFCARKLWGLLIDDYLGGEIDTLPILIDCKFQKFSKVLDEIFQIRPLGETKETEFVQLATENWTQYSLPNEENIDQLKIFLIVDSVDELDNLDVLQLLMNFASNRGIPALFFCRTDF